MKVHTLRVDCNNDGDLAVSIWVDCDTAAEIDDLITWLRLAKTFAQGWNRRKRAKQANVVKLEGMKK
jgi:hypothetical protein